MASRGYRLAQTDLLALPTGMGVTAGWGILTFERVGAEP
jgi:hypothetical protein